MASLMLIKRVRVGIMIIAEPKPVRVDNAAANKPAIHMIVISIIKFDKNIKILKKRQDEYFRDN